VRRFINAHSTKEIIFVRGTTEAINLVAQSFARPRFKPGDEIIVTALEHHANIVPWQMVCEQTGCTLKVAPINKRGELLFDEYLKLLSPRTRLVAVAHVSNALGSILPVKRIVDAAHAQGAVVLVDGAQAVPTLTSMFVPSGATSTLSPGTSFTDQQASACCTAARSCWSPCRRGKAAAT